MQKELVLISGLGADKQVFDFLKLDDFEKCYIEWIDPIKNESIENYARRIIDQIHFKKPVLIGVSFGGMIAVEIGKLIPTEKIILISSAKTKNDIPVYFKMAGWLNLNRFIPVSLLKTVSPVTYWFFGLVKKDEKELLKSFIIKTPTKFLKWAIDKIVHWRNEVQLPNVIHINGSNDRLLPNRKADYQIKNAGHLMIINRANELRPIIFSLLKSNLPKYNDQFHHLEYRP